MISFLIWTCLPLHWGRTLRCLNLGKTSFLFSRRVSFCLHDIYNWSPNHLFLSRLFCNRTTLLLWNPGLINFGLLIRLSTKEQYHYEKESLESWHFKDLPYDSTNTMGSVKDKELEALRERLWKWQKSQGKKECYPQTPPYSWPSQCEMPLLHRETTMRIHAKNI